jgi:hypothetical protein
VVTRVKMCDTRFASKLSASSSSSYEPTGPFRPHWRCSWSLQLVLCLLYFIFLVEYVWNVLLWVRSSSIPSSSNQFCAPRASHSYCTSLALCWCRHFCFGLEVWLLTEISKKAFLSIVIFLYLLLLTSRFLILMSKLGPPVFHINLSFLCCFII